jgi:transposase
MTTAERIKELRQKIKHIKKTSKGGADFRKLIRLQALLAYYRQRSRLDQIALHFDLSVKSLKRWIKRYESDGVENLSDRDRKGRPCQLTDEQKELLKAELARDKQRVWVARHIAVLLQTLFGVAYSVGYLTFLRELLFQIDFLLIGEPFGNPLKPVVDGLDIGAELWNSLFVK